MFGFLKMVFSKLGKYLLIEIVFPLKIGLKFAR